jgi:V8-like Glu-specific endopeptidase
MTSLPDRGVDPLYTAVTPILYPNNSGHATGFFYTDIGDTDPEQRNQRDEDIYLITNHHAVADDDGDPICDSIRIITRPNPQNLTELKHHDIELYDDGNPQWREHPEGSEIDVVAISLDINLNDSGTKIISNQLRMPDNVEVTFGQEAVVLGYPIRGQSPYLPIARNAMIASPYGVPFQGIPCFGTDADMHSGTSGSPVLTRPSALQQTTDGFQLGGQQQMHFLGIHSATMQSNHELEEGPLNINVTWYAELLDEIIR